MESVESAPSIPFKSMQKKAPNLCPAMLGTPEKSMPPPRVRNQNPAPSIGDVERSFDLPERYSILCQFFNVIVSVIPLLRMRKKSPTFTNICLKVQTLTHRRFTVNHLAQLKYIVPEAILVKRIRVRDELTDCMKEELLITLDLDAVKASDNMGDIRVIFRGRVEDYYETHIEESEIPAGELPSLFFQTNQNEGSRIDESSCVAPASHVPRLFQRSFSHKQTTEAWLRKSRLCESSRALNVLVATPIKESSAGAKDGSSVDDLSKEINSLVMKDGSEGVVDILQGTPPKEALTPVRLTDNVPAMKPSKRCHVSSGDDTCDIPTKLVRRANRFLELEAHENSAVADVETDDALGSNIDSEIIDFLPGNLLQSARENERKIVKEQDPAISQAMRRHQLMSGVPKLFDMIHLLFRSINRSFMTKEELMYKLITSHCEIVDRGELEEQFKLLQQLAPEYISERMCSSGDALVRLNKSASAESVHAKLQEA